MTIALGTGMIRLRIPLRRVLGDEGFRVFFPLAALHLALWPVLWTLVHGLDLPLARTMPAGLWHAQEMLIGGFGAALIGFITTAVPEWTDTRRLQHGRLFALAGLWAGARLIGLLGADAATPVAALLDTAWLSALVVYLLVVSWRKRTTRLLAFAGWITALLSAALAVRLSFWASDFAQAQTLIRVLTLGWCGLLGLALARISVPVTNLVLDPCEQTSPTDRIRAVSISVQGLRRSRSPANWRDCPWQSPAFCGSRPAPPS